MIKRVFVLLYGSELSVFIKLRPKPEEPIICGGTGISLIKKLKHIPRNIILSGDLDSIPKKDLDWCKKNKNVKIMKYPEDKDFTDGHLALDYICKKYNKKVDKIVLGGITNQLDHTLGNIFPIIPNIKRGHSIKFINKRQVIYLSNKQIELYNCKNHIISLIPIESTLVKKTEGLKWKLVNEKIGLYQSRTLRNLAANNKVKIEFSTGVLMVIESW